MGISPLEMQGVVRAKDGSPLTVTLQSLAHAMVKRDAKREQFIPYMRHTLEEPYEVLLTEYENNQGKTKYRKKFIGLFHAQKAEALMIVAEMTPAGEVIWNFINVKKSNLDRMRKGVKLFYGK